ncbi:coil containing protein [Vibrio phage 1.015.O._10N.222.51.E5]|nr:coil containing protein [Vibrio phage 1.015.O._10N.222.51.E5]
MSGNNLFDQSNDNSQTNNNVDDELLNLSPEEQLAKLVGEDGKFKSVAELAKAHLHLTKHSTTLESENSQLREQTAQAKAIEDVLAVIKPQADNGAEQQSQQATPDNGDTPAQVTPETIAEMVAAQVEAKLNAKEQSQSVSDVKSELIKRFGNDAGRVYEAKGRELGISLDELAAKSPQAVLQLFGTAQQQQQSSNTFNSGKQNSQQTPEVDTSIDTKAGLQEMYKKGEISLAKKHEMEHAAVTRVGIDKFMGR